MAYSLVAAPAVRLQPVIPLPDSDASAVQEPDGALPLAPFQIQNLERHWDPILQLNTACLGEFNDKPATHAWQGMGHAVGEHVQQIALAPFLGFQSLPSHADGRLQAGNHGKTLGSQLPDDLSSAKEHLQILCPNHRFIPPL